MIRCLKLNNNMSWRPSTINISGPCRSWPRTRPWLTTRAWPRTRVSGTCMLCSMEHFSWRRCATGLALSVSCTVHEDKSFSLRCVCVSSKVDKVKRLRRVTQDVLLTVELFSRRRRWRHIWYAVALMTQQHTKKLCSICMATCHTSRCCCCGSVGRAFAFDTRGSQFESSHWQVLYFYFLSTVFKRRNKWKIGRKWPSLKTCHTGLTIVSIPLFISFYLIAAIDELIFRWAFNVPPVRSHRNKKKKIDLTNDREGEREFKEDQTFRITFLQY